jgi:hypothetical protein
MHSAEEILLAVMLSLVLSMAQPLLPSSTLSVTLAFLLDGTEPLIPLDVNALPPALLLVHNAKCALAQDV